MNLPAQDQSFTAEYPARKIVAAILSSWPHVRVALLLWTSVAGMLASASVPERAYASTLPSCVGDCDADGVVTVDEIVLVVNIILGLSPVESCPPLTAPPDVADVVLAINAALAGCPATPTPTTSQTPTATPTPGVEETPAPTATMTSLMASFELGAGSTITYSDGDAIVIEESLTGGFTLVYDHIEPQFFVFHIAALGFESERFNAILADQSGRVCVWQACMSAFVEANVVINGESFDTFGIADVGGCPTGVPLFEPFELCTDIENISQCAEIRAGTRAGYVLEILPLLVPAASFNQ